MLAGRDNRSRSTRELSTVRSDYMIIVFIRNVSKDLRSTLSKKKKNTCFYIKNEVYETRLINVERTLSS